MKIEVYDSNTLQHVTTLTPEQPNLANDYMYQLNLDIQVLPNSINILNCLAVVSTDKNEQLFVGTIVNQEYTQIVIQSILDKFNITILPQFYEGIIEDGIAAVITNNWISGNDPLRNIPYLRIAKLTQTQGTYDIKEQEQFKITLSNIFKYFNIVVTPVFDYYDKTLTLEIEKKGQTTTFVSDDLIGVNVTSNIESNKLLNEAVYYNQLNVYLDTYILHKDGSVTTLANANDNLRFENVVFDNFIYDDTGEESLTDVANKQLKKNEFNHQITVEIQLGMHTIEYDKLGVGNYLRIKTNNKIINTIITGYTIDYQTKVITLLCGFERVSKLKKERMYGK